MTHPLVPGCAVDELLHLSSQRLQLGCAPAVRPLLGPNTHVSPPHIFWLALALAFRVVLTLKN